MSNNDHVVLLLRVEIIEALLCQKSDFKSNYLDALNILTELIKNNGEKDSEELFSVLEKLMVRINQIPTVD